MIWNVAGWLGSGLLMNHAHHGSDSHICEVAFCYCETADGEAVCTCHHNDVNTKNDHSSENSHTGGVCYFTDGHSPQTASSHLIFTSSLNGYYYTDRIPLYSLKASYLPDELHTSLPSGITSFLLRPPQV